MPGRRVSTHSTENTLPLTVALPIFRSSVFISTGLTLMGLPIRTGPDGPPPDGADGAAAAFRCEGSCSSFSVTRNRTSFSP